MADPSRKNEGLIKNLKTIFVQLFAPSTTYGNILSMFTNLPGLRGYWTMSNPAETDDMPDMSGHGRRLTHYP